jgi:aldose 1-epimerase
MSPPAKVQFVSDELLRLRSAMLDLVISPSAGGSIAAFQYLGSGGKIPILRGGERNPVSILDAASFPLVPYVNRIKGGSFRFRGREIRIAANMPGDPSPLHGQGWLEPWTVEGVEEGFAALTFRHEAGEWPWAYEARQDFHLDKAGLSLHLICRNLSDEPMPCGLGQHPYFPCTGNTRLDTEVQSAWTVDENVLPVAEVPAEGPYNLRERRVCGQDLDNGFGGWGGRALIFDPALPFEIELSAPDAGFFQLYSPASGSLFVAEPVTHANAAMNEPEERWEELGLRVLAPGEAMRLATRLEVIPSRDEVSH